jgi:hypothetical protein
MEQLTGQVANSIAPVAMTPAVLLKDVAASDLMVMDTSANGALPHNLVNDHAYMFESGSEAAAVCTCATHGAGMSRWRC